MTAAGDDDITAFLNSLQAEDPNAETQIVERIYHELHDIAKRYMTQERSDHTLQPTAIVHEAYLRIMADKSLRWTNRQHFFSVAARVMRHLLVDHARRRRSRKAGGDHARVAYSEDWLKAPPANDHLIEIDQALERLASWDARQSQIVELRFFVGLTEVEIAQLLRLSVRTIKREWKVARAWLHAELTGRVDDTGTLEAS